MRERERERERESERRCGKENETAVTDLVVFPFRGLLGQESEQCSHHCTSVLQ